ncbi:hypothetical protein Moror_12482 [Moniliophthora roreri MCA 2997]|uniref:Uncharacterized protein n=1 Tax=Moniliophthora roreri (strain MCA 2997) TaxID=1381753 RepID=V2X9A3_MONRO|nr:hypothetical protein Moror_12482 [Moniliophthora roreri MCA 2997]
MASPTFSLYEHITAFQSEKDYKATRLAKFLIRAFARDACLSQWDVSDLCYHLVHARKRYDEIHSWIACVESDTQTEDARWDAFDKYTNNLDELERALFDLVVALDKEHELFTELHTQAQRRAPLHDVSLSMRLIEELVEGSFKKKSIFSPSCFRRSLRRICILIKEWFMAITARSDRTYQACQDTLDFIENRIDEMRKWDQRTDTKPDLTLHRSAFANAVYVLSILRLLNPETPLTPEHWTKISDARKKIPHGGSSAYHKLVPELITIIIKIPEGLTRPAGTDTKPPDIKPVEPVGATPVTPAKLPSFYPELKRKATEIRRPYFLQAVTFIRICERLARALKAEGENRPREAENIIEITFLSVEAALDAAVNALSESGSQGITSVKSDSVTELFSGAQEPLRNCFTFFKIKQEWQEWDNKMKAAAKRDTDHLNLLQDRMRMHAKCDNPLSSKTPVTIQLQFVRTDPFGGWEVHTPKTVSYEISVDSNLQTLLSMEASRNDEFGERIMSLKSYFALSKDDFNQMRSPETKIKDIDVVHGIRSLILVLGE